MKTSACESARAAPGGQNDALQPVPRFLQAIRAFEGRGLDDYVAFEPPLRYRVPDGRQSQCVYFRGGNSAENLLTDSELELHVAAPVETRGTVVIDLGILEL